MVKARGAGGGPEEGLDERVQSCTRTSSVTHQLEWISSLLEGRAAGAPGFVSGSERGCPVTRGTDQGTEQAKVVLARPASSRLSGSGTSFGGSAFRLSGSPARFGARTEQDVGRGIPRSVSFAPLCVPAGARPLQTAAA